MATSIDLVSNTSYTTQMGKLIDAIGNIKITGGSGGGSSSGGSSGSGTGTESGATAIVGDCMIFSGTLAAGQSTLIIADPVIQPGDNYLYEFFSDGYGFGPSNVEIGNGFVFFRFPVMVENLTIRVKVTTWEIVGNTANTTVLSSTLLAGETTLIFTNDAITENGCIYEFFTNEFGVSPIAAEIIENGTMQVTFRAGINNLPVKLRITTIS